MYHPLAPTLQGICGRQYTLPTGRGATAIYLALRAAGLRNRKVVLPGNICPAAVCPVIYSGNLPVFCDIRLTDFAVDLASLQAALDEGAAAAIIPHPYGHAAPIAEGARLCRDAGALLIEDAATALGGRPGGAPAGSWGDCSVLSFGYSKIVDAGQGGALLTDHRDLYEHARRLLAELPSWSPRLERRAADMAQVIRGWWNARRTESRLDHLLKPLWGFYEDTHLWQLPVRQELKICTALGCLDEILAERRTNAEVYREALANDPVACPEPGPGSVCWRYTCLIDATVRDDAVNRLRATGVDVSTLYPAAHRQFATPSSQDLPNCDRLEHEVINLWVAPPLTPVDIRATVAQVRIALGNAPDPGSRD